MEPVIFLSFLASDYTDCTDFTVKLLKPHYPFNLYNPCLNNKPLKLSAKPYNIFPPTHRFLFRIL